jgi:hypothetical protein
MLTWFFNPWMLLGGLAVASPILIHLLNKRRFKIVEWAAMDFLFEAEKKNKRRVQIENMILLLLRCLAMLLLAFMVARPFLPSGVMGAFAQTRQLERILVIDDSLSQRVLVDSMPAMQKTKESVKELLRGFASSNESEDWVSVWLTSDPNQRLIDYKPLTESTLPEILQVIEQIQCSDQVADYSASLGELDRYLQGQRENVGRAVYLYSDLRTRDWKPLANQDAEAAPKNVAKRVAENSVGTFVVDTGGEQDQNLAITGIRPDGLLVSDKSVSFLVDVTNFGTQTVNEISVLFQVNDSQAEYERIGVLGPGKTETLVFNYFFNRPVAGDLLEDRAQKKSRLRNFKIRAEIDRQSLGEDLKQDQLIEDSSRFYAARILEGIPVLLVDGDPSAISERSETHYLQSLNVPGTGLAMTDVTVSELETVSLADYQIIFLCNVDEASPDRIKELGKWVEDGGSLVFMPGNRVRAGTFNDAFHKEGAGLSPLKLDRMAGDPTMSRWVNFEPGPQLHPSIRVIMESDASSLGKIDIFSWWASSLDENLIGKSVEVPLRLTDKDNSPAMVDRTLGDGRVVVFAIPGDGDWTMWPSSPTYAPVMIDLIDYLLGQSKEASTILLGDEINQPIDLSAFNNRVKMRDPAEETIEAVAKPVEESDTNAIIQQVSFENTGRAGFYELKFQRHDGGTESTLYASNYDPQESRLDRLSAVEQTDTFSGENLQLVSGEELASQSVSGSNTEIWLQVLMVLFGILVTEQLLAYWWGRKR